MTNQQWKTIRIITNNTKSDPNRSDYKRKPTYQVRAVLPYVANTDKEECKK
jgi:hypothetical protein